MKSNLKNKIKMVPSKNKNKLKKERRSIRNQRRVRSELRI